MSQYQCKNNEKYRCYREINNKLISPVNHFSIFKNHQLSKWLYINSKTSKIVM